MINFIKLFKSLRPSYENAYDMKTLANNIAEKPRTIEGGTGGL